MVKSNPARQVELGLLGLFALLLVWLPLPLASNRVWSTGMLAVAAWSLLTLFGAKLLFVCIARRNHPQAPRSRAPASAWIAAALLGAFTVWSALPLLSTSALRSASPYDTAFHVLRWASALAVFLLTLQLATTSRRRMFVVVAMLSSSALQAALGLVLFASQGSSYTLWGTRLELDGRAAGTFANSDHLAFYLLMGLCAGIGLMLAQMGSAQAPVRLRWQERIAHALEFVFTPKMVVRLTLVLLVVALVLTRSRAGNGIFLIALVVLCTWVMLTSPRLRKPAFWLLLSMVIVDMIVIGQWVGLDKVVQRLERTDVRTRVEAQISSDVPASVHSFREESLEERLEVAHDALALVKASPIWGHGGGSFYTVMPAVKQDGRPWRFDHAHNDYVEIASDCGLVGLALLLLLHGSTLIRAVRLVSDRSAPEDRGLAAGLGLALLCAALHAAVDFNFQVTANIVTLNLLAGLIWCIPMPGRTKPLFRK